MFALTILVIVPGCALLFGGSHGWQDVSWRLGLTKNVDPGKVEQDLMKLLPSKHWVMFNHRMIYHGRRVCYARKPDCAGCTLAPLCPKVGVKIPGT